METYVVKRETPKFTMKARVAAALLYGAMFFVGIFSCRLLWPSPSERSQGTLTTAVWLAIEALIWGALMGFGRPFLPKRLKLGDYKLLVDDDSITGVTERTGWMRWWTTRRTVRKGRVRTIFEIRAKAFRGLGVSERSKLGARLWGFVYLPQSLPEFEELKQLVEGWRTSDDQPGEADPR
jgi:hypothetical protein